MSTRLLYSFYYFEIDKVKTKNIILFNNEFFREICLDHSRNLHMLVDIFLLSLESYELNFA